MITIKERWNDLTWKLYPDGSVSTLRPPEEIIKIIKKEYFNNKLDIKCEWYPGSEEKFPGTSFSPCYKYYINKEIYYNEIEYVNKLEDLYQLTSLKRKIRNL